MKDRIKLKIGDFSRLMQVSMRTLRYYEEIGLLKPYEVDEWTGYRYYLVNQMVTVSTICSLKEAGFSLEEIRDFFEDGNLVPEAESIREKIEQCDRQIERLNTRKKILQLMLDRDKRVSTNDRFSIQSLPALTVASYRACHHSYKEFLDAMENIANPEIEKLGCVRIPNNISFTTIHNEIYDPSLIDIEYCQEVVEAGRDSDIIHFKQMPAIPMALCMTIWGGYDGINQAFPEIYSYMEQNGYESDGKYRLCFVNGPWNKSDNSKWLTIIQQPIRRITNP